MPFGSRSQFNARYTKGAPFLFKMVYKRVRGWTSPYKASVNDPPGLFVKPCFKTNYAYAGNYTVKVVPAFNVRLYKRLFLKYKGVRPRGTPS